MQVSAHLVQTRLPSMPGLSRRLSIKTETETSNGQSIGASCLFIYFPSTFTHGARDGVRTLRGHMEFFLFGFCIYIHDQQIIIRRCMAKMKGRRVIHLEDGMSRHMCKQHATLCLLLDGGATLREWPAIFCRFYIIQAPEGENEKRGNTKVVRPVRCCHREQTGGFRRCRLPKETINLLQILQTFRHCSCPCFSSRQNLLLGREMSM